MDVPALPTGQSWVLPGLGGSRAHIANDNAHRTHCGRELILPRPAVDQATEAPEELEEICRRCAERILTLATAMGLI